MQNTTHAVMAQRWEGKDSLDDFPTPPWATRALAEHVIDDKASLRHMMCLEPACGAGHMAKALDEYFAQVDASDVHAHGYGRVSDFTTALVEPKSYDWVITNPPFRLAEVFVHQALRAARRGVAVLTRTVFIESVGRYNRLFRDHPPTKFAQFSERVPMVRGRLDRQASTATGYAWLVWELESTSAPRLMWVPPCRKALERDADYIIPPCFAASSIPRTAG